MTKRDIGIIYNCVSKRFMLVEWIRRPKAWGSDIGTFTEMESMSDWPGFYPYDLITVEWVWNRCRPAEQVYQEMVDRFARRRGHEEHVIRQNHYEKQAEVRRLLRKGMKDAAVMVESGMTPFAGDDDAAPALEFTEEVVESVAKDLDKKGR